MLPIGQRARKRRRAIWSERVRTRRSSTTGGDREIGDGDRPLSDIYDVEIDSPIVGNVLENDDDSAAASDQVANKNRRCK